MKRLFFIGVSILVTFSSWSQVNLSSGAYLNNSEFRLRASSDNYHYLKWSGFSGVNGVELAGYGGGHLGSTENGSFKEVLRWTNYGHVGIGTSNPLEQLHVTGNAQIQSYEPKLRLVNNWANSFGGNTPKIEFDNGNYPIWSIDARVSGEEGFYITKRMGNQYNHVFAIKHDNIVGIGTDNFTPELNAVGERYRLYVKGGLKTEEVKVELCAGTWCDYVFEDDYDLKPLTEVEQYIEKEGHLHNTPSAATLEEEGLELKSITINQQEKIEELFLHMIEMDKKVTRMNQELQDLKTENSSLKATLKKLKQARI